MISNDKISVIVPVYKVEKLLNRCVDSILGQSYTNLEVILVDDGSPDNSGVICDEYAKNDSRVKVIHKVNSGAAAARNTGLEVATGDYIAFVDSDDYIDKNMYKDMMEINEQYDCDVVLCDCFKENKTSQYIFTHDIREGYYDYGALVNEYYKSLLMTNSVDYPASISNCVLLIKKKVINENGLKYKEGMRFSEDLLFGSQVMYCAKSFYYMKNKTYYHYIVNENSVTNTYYENKWEMMYKLYLAIKDYFLPIKEYDFSKQVNLTLLYIVYHCIGNIKGSNYSNKVKKEKILEILNDKEVKGMFKNIEINKLDISWKLKLITYSYKFKISLFFYI